MTPRTTVVMAVHNGADLIGRALASLASQVLPPASVVIVDDGSTDRLSAALSSAGFDGLLLRQEHAGQAAAINLGLAHVSTDLVGFLDHDDEWTPTKLERHTRLLMQSGADVIVGAVTNVITDPDGSERRVQLGPSRLWAACTFRSGSILEAGPLPSDGRSHENVGWWSARASSLTVAFDEEEALLRHIHGGNFGIRERARVRTDLVYRVRQHCERSRTDSA